MRACNNLVEAYEFADRISAKYDYEIINVNGTWFVKYW